MYRDEHGQLVVSPSDLVAFLECRHLTQLQRKATEGRLPKPDRPDEQLEVIQQRGIAHEQSWRQRLEQAGLQVVDAEEASAAGLAGQLWATQMAMRDGAEVIFQATFLVDDGVRWRGHADFLHRVDGDSRLGGFHYRPADTKLARHVKPSAVLQLCGYTELLERVQGRQPATVEVVLDGQEQVPLRTDDFMAYYRAVKDRTRVV
jgi:uncharacterized protein